MIKGLYTAYTGMVNQQNRLDVLTNDLANSDTNGFKAEFATSQSFDDMYSYKVKDLTESVNGYAGRRLGTVRIGVKIGESYTDYSVGSFRETGSTYDLALSGSGFFAISFTNRDGETSMKLTRDGAFCVNADGYLMTKDGDYVLNQSAALSGTASQAGYIRVDPNLPVEIDRDGIIYQNSQQVARVGVIDVDDYNYLEKYGENMWEIVDGGNIIASDSQVYQGYLEMSNVQVVKDMVEMIVIQRAYESNQKLIQTIDSMTEVAVTQVGKI